MGKMRIIQRQVNGVPVAHIHRRLGYTDDVRTATETVADWLGRSLRILPTEEIDAYSFRGVKAIPEKYLQRVIEHGSDRFSDDVKPPYEPQDVCYDPTKAFWAYPIGSSPFYAINSALWHALDERRKDPSLKDSREPVGLLVLDRMESVQMQPNLYASANLPKALRKVVLIHFW